MYEYLAIAAMTKIAQTPDTYDSETGTDSRYDYVLWDEDNKQYYRANKVPSNVDPSSLTKVPINFLDRATRDKAVKTLSYAPAELTMPRVNRTAIYSQPDGGRDVKMNQRIYPANGGAPGETLHGANVNAAIAEFMFRNKDKFKHFNADKYQGYIDKARDMNEQAYVDPGDAIKAQEYYNTHVPVDKITLNTRRLGSWKEGNTPSHYTGERMVYKDTKKWGAGEGGSQGHADPSAIFSSASSNYSKMPSFSNATKNYVEPISKSDKAFFKPVWRHLGVNDPTVKKAPPVKKKINSRTTGAFKEAITPLKNTIVDQKKPKPAFNTAQDRPSDVSFDPSGLNMQDTGTR